MCKRVRRRAEEKGNIRMDRVQGKVLILTVTPIAQVFARRRCQQNATRKATRLRRGRNAVSVHYTLRSVSRLTIEQDTSQER
jgi:hypothetical protein